MSPCPLVLWFVSLTPTSTQSDRNEVPKFTNFSLTSSVHFPPSSQNTDRLCYTYTHIHTRFLVLDNKEEVQRSQGKLMKTGAPICSINNTLFSCSISLPLSNVFLYHVVVANFTAMVCSTHNEVTVLITRSLICIHICVWFQG